VQSHFRIDRSYRRITASSDIQGLVTGVRICHFTQRLQVRYERNDTLVLASEEPLPARKCQAAVSYRFVATVDRPSISCLIVAVQAETVVCREIDPIFAYGDRIAVLQSGLLCVVDFDFGLARCFKVRYEGRQPCGCALLSDFSFGVRTISVPGGVHYLVASACEEKIVFWEMFTGGRSTGWSGWVGRLGR
jgi:hypothetical protein